MSTTADDLWPPVSAAAYDRGAERLLGAIASICDSRAGFAAQVDAGLRATLAFFAGNPNLARLLVPRPYGGGEEALLRQRRWRQRYADLLRRAAARSPEAATHPPFLEPALIGGISFQICRYLLEDRAEQLPDLLPDLREYLFVYYLGAGSTSASTPSI